MRRFLPLLGVVLWFGLASGCSSPTEEQPLTPEEHLAGTWTMTEVEDAETGEPITPQFRTKAGTWTLHFESVGCCRESASYTLVVEDLELVPPVTRMPIYFPRTAQAPAVSLESPYRGGAVTAYFRFEGPDDNVLVLRFERGDLRNFGFDFFHQSGFAMQLERVD